jgi:hypothetical protein
MVLQKRPKSAPECCGVSCGSQRVSGVGRVKIEVFGEIVDLEEDLDAIEI